MISLCSPGAPISNLCIPRQSSANHRLLETRNPELGAFRRRCRRVQMSAQPGTDDVVPDESLLPRRLTMNADKAGSRILGERFHWSQRTTGITEHFEAYFGRWTHYDVAALPDLEVSRSGRIRKSLKGGDPEDNTFILNSCFEMGPDLNKQHGMAQGFAPFVTKRDDGKQFFSHPFKYSPGRAFCSQNPKSFIWTGVPQNTPETWKTPHCHVNKAMLVRPKAATWAGTPYVPEWHLVKEANEEADEKDLSHFCSVEMWLSDDEQERVKKGVLFGYNTVTGEPAVLFRCHERRPDGSQVVPDVDDNFSFDDVAPKIINDCPLTGQAYPDQETALPSVPEMVEKYGLKGDASVLQIEWDDSAACTTEGAGHRETMWEKVDIEDIIVWDPTAGDDRYLHMKFDDGVYLNIPRNLNLFEEEFVYEFGAYVLPDRALAKSASPAAPYEPKAVHRLVSIARRSKHGHNVLTYERYE